MNNRFNGCKTLEDLYDVFASQEGVQEFENLSEEELHIVAVVFEAKLPKGAVLPVIPLNKAGYTYIWNVVVEEIETAPIPEEEMEEVIMEATMNNVTNNINNEEEEVMMNKGTVKGNVDAAVEEMMDKFAQAKENIKVNAGETKDEYINKVDDSLNVMKSALGNVLGTLDGILGYSVLKNSILDMMEAGSDGKTSKKDLFKMARRCRDLIEVEIENLEFWGDEESFKKAIQLKALTEGDRGKSIFEAFVSGVIWIGKKVARKLRKWFQVDEEKSIIGSICRSIAGFANVLRAGIKFVWNTAKFAVSFVVAGVVKVADFIVRAIKSVVANIKEWSDARLQFADIDDDIADDIADYEDILEEEVAE